MAIDFTRKVVYKVTADSKDAERSFKGLKGGIEDVTKQARSLGVEIEDTRSHWQKLTAAAQGGASGLADGIKNMHAGFSGAAKGLDDLVGKFAPYNQALELAGKAAKFVGEGIEAYGKTSPAAAAEVKKLTDELNSTKKAAMELTGEIAVGFLKSVNPIEAATKSMRGFEGAVMDAFKQFNSPEAQAARAMGFMFGGGLSSLVPARDTWGDQRSITDLIGDGAAKLKADHEAKLKADHEAKLKAAASRQSRYSDYASMTGMDTAGPMLGFSASSSLGASAMYSDNTRALIDQMREAQDASRTAGWMGELGATNSRRSSYLEQALGPIEQFDAYTQGFDALGQTFNAFGEAVGAGYEALITGQAGVGQAIKQTAAAGMLATGKSSLIEGLRETALGVGKLALGPLGGPSAAMHFKSAAMHAAVAAVAGAGAAALGAGQSAPATPAAAASSASGSNARGGSGSGNGSGASNTREIVYVYGDPFSDDSPRNRRRTAAKAIRRVIPDYGHDS